MFKFVFGMKTNCELGTKNNFKYIAALAAAADRNDDKGDDGIDNDDDDDGSSGGGGHGDCFQMKTLSASLIF